MPGTRQKRPQKVQTRQFRAWKGVNLTDARTAIDDDELAWLENVVSVGKGSLQVLPSKGATVATIAAGVASVWGVNLSGTSVIITVNSDGSMSQVTTGGVVTAVCVAGTVTTAAHVAIWRTSPVLIVDPTKGYFSWDGTIFTVIDATKLGSSIAIFEGRVWLGNNRTITYTAPNTNNDFTAANGGGSTVLTDEAFPGNIIALVSALEQLWIVGQGAIDALANVVASGVAPAVVTTFSITNIVTNVGSNAANSVIGYFRALALMAPFGAYALSGVTPQKLSDKLDGLFSSLTLTPDVPAAVAVVQNLPCLLFLVTYTGTNAQAQVTTPGNISMILGFTQGKWFFAVQGTTLRWITTLLVSGVSEAWGTDGSTIFKLFGAASTSTTVYKVQSKLYDFGLATTMKALMKFGFEYQATAPVSPTLTADSESSSATVTVSQGNTVTWTNAAGATVSWTNSLGQVVTWFAQGLVLSRADAPLFGRYLGWSLVGADIPYRIQAVQMQYVETREWDTGRAA